MLDERVKRQELLLEQLYKNLPAHFTLGWTPSGSKEDLAFQNLKKPTVQKIETLDTNPAELVSKLRTSLVGQFYISRLKRFGVLRWMARWIWRYGYPIYVNQVVARLSNSKTKRWRTLIRFGDYLKSHHTPTRKILDAVLIETSPPQVFPVIEPECVALFHSAYKYPEIYVASVVDALIYGGSNLVLVDELVLCHDLYEFESDFTSEELHGRTLIDPDKKRIRWMTNDSDPVRLSVAAVFLDACASNYAHWMTEVLPRIFLFCSTDISENTPIVVNDGLHKNIMESLFLVTGSNREIITLPVGRALSVAKLYVTSPTGYVPFDRRVKLGTSHSHGRFSATAFIKLRIYLDSLDTGSEFEVWPEKVYLRRNSSARKVINESAIEKLLFSHGYVSIEPEKLTFLQQIKLFKNARKIISPTGAALASAIVCRTGTKIAILMGEHKDMIYGYWNSLLDPIGIQVRNILGKISEHHDAGIHGDFEVNIKDIRDLLENFEADQN